MKRTYAFTLIEMMIAIVVFSIGVLAVLRILTGDLSLMDHTDMKLQSTVYWKEGLELLYNVRDSNFEKELPWNCIMNTGIYPMKNNELSALMANASSINDKICKWYFGGDTSQIVQLSFDENYYIFQNITWKSADFNALFGDNQLCLFTWKIHNEDMVRYSYCTQKWWWEPTFFARYLSFTWVDISDPSKVNQPQTILSKEKILKVESHILYKKWHNTWEFVFESFIWNY